MDIYDTADAIKYWYDIPKKDRKKRGLTGRNWMLNEGGLNHTNMCKTLSDGMEIAFQNWKPKERYNLYKLK